jgi:hypothetical protein
MTALIMLIGAALLWFGCSKSPATISDSHNIEPDISQYFPLQTGSAVRYMEVNNKFNDTSFYWISIGEYQNIGAWDVYQWTKTIEDYPGHFDIGYLYCDDNALYLLEGENQLPEKILEGPLEIGNVWQRYSPSNSRPFDSDDFVFYNDDEKNHNHDNGLGDANNENRPEGKGAPKIFPTVGSNRLEISAIENIDLDNGNSFDNAIKIENMMGNSENYYWYAPRIGLVKYVLGAGSEPYPYGEVVGEIVRTR